MKCEEDLDNLMLRREVLELEQQSVMSAIQDINDQIMNENKQMDRIDLEKERIHRQIEDLQLQ